MNKKQTGVRISETLLRRAKVEAARRGISLSALVELALEQFLKGATK